MADSSSNPFQNRSISLPTGSNPILNRVEECLRVMKEWRTKQHSLNDNGLGFLQDLYRSTSDFLRMVQTQQALRGRERSVSKSVDEFLRLLDVCGILKDSLVQMREQQQSLLSMFRRKDQNLSTGICKYHCMRRKMKKDLMKCMQLLKSIDGHADSLKDHTVHEILRDVRANTISVLQILVSLVSLNNSTKPILSRLRLLSSKKDGGVDEERRNEIEMLDEALFAISGDSSEVDEIGVESARRIMESLEDFLREVEDELDGVSRCLINARVSLLNILTWC